MTEDTTVEDELNSYDRGEIYGEMSAAFEELAAQKADGELDMELDDIVVALADRLNATPEAVARALVSLDEDFAERLGHLTPDAPDPAGQKVDLDVDADALAERIARAAERRAAEFRDEAQRDDLGRPRGTVLDRVESVTDDHGNPKRRGGLTPAQKRRKLADGLEDVEPVEQAPTGDTGDESDGEVDPRVAEAAEREGW